MRNFTVRLRKFLSSFYHAKSANVVVLSFILTTQVGCPNIIPEVKSLFDGSTGNDYLTVSAPSLNYANSASTITYTLQYSADVSLITVTTSDITPSGTASCTVSSVTGGGLTWFVTLNGCSGNGSVQISVNPGTATDPDGALISGVGPSTAFTVDNTLPIVSCSNPSGTSFSNSYNVSASCSDAGGTGCLVTECRVDAGSWGTCAFVGLSNAAHSFEARSTDNAGNISTIYSCGNITVNTTSLAITSPAASTSAISSLVVSGTCVTGLPVDFSLTDMTTPASTTCTAGAFSTPVTFSSGDGNKSIDVSQTDMFSTVINSSRIFVNDTTAPTAPSITITNTPYTNSPTDNLTLSATESASTPMQMWISNTGCMTSGTGWITYSTSHVFTLSSNTSNTIYAAFRDSLGNTTGCVNDSTIHDNTAPTFPTAISVTNIGALISGNNETVSWTTQDTNLDTGTVTLLEFSSDNGSNWSTISGTINSNNNTPTNYNWTIPAISCVSNCRLRVTTQDLLGQTFSSQTAAFSIVGPVNNFLVSYPTTVTAGVSQVLTVTARDANNQTVSNYAGTANLSSTDPSVFNLPASTSAFTAGVASVASVELRQTGTQTFSAVDGGISGTSSNITVNSGPLNALEYDVQPSATAQAGTDFTTQPIIKAVDAFDNIVTSFNNTINFVAYYDSGCTSSPTATSLSVVSIPASSGLASLAGLDYTKAETIYIKSYYSTYSTCSNAITIDPAPRDHFYVSWTGSSLVTAGTIYDITVEARDPYENIDINYTGTVSFSTADGQAVLPANYSFLPGDAGVKVFTSGIELRTAGGPYSIMVDDGSVNASIPGINVIAAGADHLEITGPSTVTADSCVAYTVTRKDPYNNPAPDASPVTVNFSAFGPKSKAYDSTSCLNEITQINISASTASGTFYFYNVRDDAGFPENLNINADDPGPLTLATKAITVNPRLPWGNGTDGFRTVNTSLTNVTTDTTVMGRTFSAVRQVTNMPSPTGVDVNPSFTGSDFVIGDEIMWMIVARGGSSTSCDTGANYKVGQYGFARIIGASATTMNFDRPLPYMLDNAYLSSSPYIGSNFCRVIVQRVPQFQQLSFSGTGSLTANPLSLADGTGGIVVFRVQNNLITSTTSYIDVIAKGYNGGMGGSSMQFQGSSSFGIDNTGSVFTALSNFTGGHRGYWTGPGNIGGGGGGNGGYGGIGYNGNNPASRSSVSTGTFNLKELFFGGGGGGAFHGSENRRGGAGGGIIMVFANNVLGSGTLFLDAYGEDAYMGTSGGFGGGGGGGGSILAQFGNIGSGVVLDKNTKGGRGGDVPAGGATTGGGGGGGGGYIHFDYCSNSGSSNLFNNVVGRIGGTANGGLNNGESGQTGVYQENPSFCPL